MILRRKRREIFARIFAELITQIENDKAQDRKKVGFSWMWYKDEYTWVDLEPVFRLIDKELSNVFGVTEYRRNITLTTSLYPYEAMSWLIVLQ